MSDDDKEKCDECWEHPCECVDCDKCGELEDDCICEK